MLSSTRRGLVEGLRVAVDEAGYDHAVDASTVELEVFDEPTSRR